MITKALQVAAGQRHVHGGGGVLLPVFLGNDLEDRGVQLVQFAVQLNDLAGDGQVAGVQQPAQFPGNADVQLGHLAEGLGNCRGHRPLGEAQARQLGQVPGQVAHPFQRGAHAQRTDNHAQVAGYRPLQGQGVNGPLIELGLQEVNLRVFGNDLLGQVHIRVGQRVPCAFHRLGHPL